MKPTDFYLNITSDNPERLQRFYEDVVGLEPRADMGPGALIIGPGAVLGISDHSLTSGPAKDPTRMLLDLWVEDVEAEQESLKAKGVTFSRELGTEYWGGVISTFADPDGNLVQLMQYKPELDTTRQEAGATA